MEFFFCSPFSNLGSEYVRDLILASIPKFLTMVNQLGPFSDNPDRPDWPKLPFVAISASKSGIKWPKKQLGFGT